MSEDTSKEIRLFLAFELPVEIKNIIRGIHQELKRSQLNIRLVKPSNIHLTIIFMGKTKAEDLDNIGHHVTKVCKQYGPFDFFLKGVGIFGSQYHPGVLWAGLGGDLKRMNYFRNALQKQLGCFGIKQENRAFKPHLTFGRFRKKGNDFRYLKDIFVKFSDLSSNVCEVRELILFKSDLKKDGAVYTKLKVLPLGG